MRELFTCPYPRKVQACLPGDCRPALRFKVSEQEKKRMKGTITYLEIGQTGKPKGPKMGSKRVNICYCYCIKFIIIVHLNFEQAVLTHLTHKLLLSIRN